MLMDSAKNITLKPVREAPSLEMDVQGRPTEKYIRTSYCLSDAGDSSSPSLDVIDCAFHSDSYIASGCRIQGDTMLATIGKRLKQAYKLAGTDP